MTKGRELTKEEKEWLDDLWSLDEAVPFSKRDILTEDDCSGDLIFEEGDKKIFPPIY